MVPAGMHSFAVRQVTSQPRYGGLVQRHQSGFLKLGFADQQTVGRDIGDQQSKRFRDPQTRCGQQAKYSNFTG